MLLRAVHTTTYNYSDVVSLCQTEVRLKPRTIATQRVIDHQLVVDPQPRSVIVRHDFFGNDVTTVAIEEPHRTLSISATSLVETSNPDLLHPALTPQWEHVRDSVREVRSEAAFIAFQFTLESPRISPSAALTRYALPSFPPTRPVLEGAMDLCHRIFSDFKYDQTSTTVTTPVEEAFRTRVGVCQDFAHVMLGCLRGLGLPARYVSGYLRTADDLIGAQASHAWLSFYCPGFGWLDIDPTNDLMPSGNHVTLAYGRDYSDVPPVKGVALGGGDHSITVEVHVTPPSPEV